MASEQGVKNLIEGFNQEMRDRAFFQPYKAVVKDSENVSEEIRKQICTVIYCQDGICEINMDNERSLRDTSQSNITPLSMLSVDEVNKIVEENQI